jgi:hypothetical protein
VLAQTLPNNLHLDRLSRHAPPKTNQTAPGLPGHRRHPVARRGRGCPRPEAGHPQDEGAAKRDAGGEPACVLVYLWLPLPHTCASWCVRSASRFALCTSAAAPQSLQAKAKLCNAATSANNPPSPHRLPNRPQVALTIQWDTQHDSPNQSTFCAVPYTRLTRRAYVTTPRAVRERFVPAWRCLLVALRKVGVRRVCAPPGGGEKLVWVVGGLAWGAPFIETSAVLCSCLAAAELTNHRINPRHVCRRPAQANVTSEGADSAAIGEACCRMWEYFQGHDWEMTWADPQARKGGGLLAGWRLKRYWGFGLLEGLWVSFMVAVVGAFRGAAWRLPRDGARCKTLLPPSKHKAQTHGHRWRPCSRSSCAPPRPRRLAPRPRDRGSAGRPQRTLSWRRSSTWRRQVCLPRFACQMQCSVGQHRLASACPCLGASLAMSSAKCGAAASHQVGRGCETYRPTAAPTTTDPRSNQT